MISQKKIDDEIKRLEKSIKNKKERIAGLPQGCLQCHRDGDYWHWYSVTVDLYNNHWGTDVEEWLNHRIEAPTYKPENLTYRCRNGIYVRSKSEQLIAGALQFHNIPYKYEEPLQLENCRLIPDFTILNPRDGKEYIWEHFGMMNDADYCTHNIAKIHTYIRNGYIPFERLITTYESKDGGIDEVWIDKIIETFFE